MECSSKMFLRQRWQINYCPKRAVGKSQVKKINSKGKQKKFGNLKIGGENNG
jgi:hypothetical protein